MAGLVGNSASARDALPKIGAQFSDSNSIYSAISGYYVGLEDPQCVAKHFSGMDATLRAVAGVQITYLEFGLNSADSGTYLSMSYGTSDRSSTWTAPCKLK